ncbi:hypothetical protein QUF72_15720 [Desulfobacterales bacterium HSG2]|nr:hypothetical protein [Desulfobacterales bacterium HSG2]
MQHRQRFFVKAFRNLRSEFRQEHILQSVKRKIGGTMRRSKRETAETLATGHFGVEPNLKRIFLLEPVIEGKPDEPIKLLEVVEGTIERGIEPIAFPADPAHGIDYPSMIVEVSPREFRDICDGKLDLGHRGWMIGKELKEGYGNATER